MFKWIKVPIPFEIMVAGIEIITFIHALLIKTQAQLHYFGIHADTRIYRTKIVHVTVYLRKKGQFLINIVQ